MDLRPHFPQLNRQVHGSPLVYLDNAATTLKPQSVIDRINLYYSEEVANIHRGAHFLGDLGTTHFESVRTEIARHIHAARAEEVVFTRGTTESINLVASGLASAGILRPGDLVLLTQLEHHSNIVPWLMLKEKLGLRVEFVPVTDQGDLDLEAFTQSLKQEPKVVAFTHISNALGTRNPVEQMVSEAKHAGALTLIDGAQALAAQPLNVEKIGCDFYAFSGHKVFGPTGVGVLYGRYDILDRLPPYQGGGSMITEVTEEKVGFLPPPQRFEAGTQHIAGVIGLGEALRFVRSFEFDQIEKQEKERVDQILQGLREIQGVRLIGEPEDRVNVVSFLVEGAHPSDVGALLDQQGIAVRTGHHCCQPLMQRLGVGGTVRASISLYNDAEDVSQFLNALRKVKEILA